MTLNNRDGDNIVYSHNTANEYTAIDGNSLTYDYAGNLTEDADGYQYEYDYENRLTRITDAVDATVAEFTYDALGRRIEKYAGDSDKTTNYYYDGWRVLSEHSGDGQTQPMLRYGPKLA